MKSSVKIIIFGLIILISFCIWKFYYNKESCKDIELLENCNIYRPSKYVYRLGDMIGNIKERNKPNGEEYHIKNFPNSIVTEYLSKTKEASNYNILADIVKHRAHNNIKLANNVCMIHLRIGDVINATKEPVTEIVRKPVFINENSWSNYSPCFPQLEKCLNKLPNIDKIIIVAGSHVECKKEKSCEYLAHIRHLLRNQGYEVEMRLGGDADEDFVFMCMAPSFISSGGSYNDRIVNTRKILNSGPSLSAQYGAIYDEDEDNTYAKLDSIFKKYGTDKSSNHHGYVGVYASLFQLLQKDRINLCEIGIGTLTDGPSNMNGYGDAGYKPGASLRAWREFFPNARLILGADIAKDCMFSDGNITTILADSTSKNQVQTSLHKLGNPLFDIIIDDGLHTVNANTNTFLNFEPYLKNSGIYIVEDVSEEDAKNIVINIKNETGSKYSLDITKKGDYKDSDILIIIKKNEERKGELNYINDSRILKNNFTLAGLPKKIALCFLIYEEIYHEDLWYQFLKNIDHDRYSIYIHYKNNKPLKHFEKYKLTHTIQTCWGCLSIVLAQNLILREALKDPKNTHFIWLSDSCVPIKSFNYISNYLDLDKSYFNMAPDSQISTQNNSILKYIKKQNIKKGAMPSIINRKHAQLFVDQNETIKTIFTNMGKIGGAPDEIVYLTLLHHHNLQDELVLTHNISANAIIFTAWPDMSNYRRFSNSSLSKNHPNTYQYICPEELDYLLQSKSLIARKFIKNCKGFENLPKYIS